MDDSLQLKWNKEKGEVSKYLSITMWLVSSLTRLDATKEENVLLFVYWNPNPYQLYRDASTYEDSIQCSFSYQLSLACHLPSGESQ